MEYNPPLLRLPDEILRKIICKLPIENFNMINMSCSRIRSFNLTRLLIPWGLEGICNKTEELSPYTRMRYARMDEQRGPLYCMYDLIAQLSIIIGDFTLWDYHNANEHDFLYLMLRAAEKPWYSIANPIRIRERKRLQLDNISTIYHKQIIKSWRLRALL